MFVILNSFIINSISWYVATLSNFFKKSFLVAYSNFMYSVFIASIVVLYANSKLYFEYFKVTLFLSFVVVIAFEVFKQYFLKFIANAFR